MTNYAIGSFAVGVILAIIGFFIAAALLRWIFGIRKIIDLLTSINARLTGAQGVGSAQSAGTVSGGVGPFQIGSGEVSIGDRLETPDGRRWTVIGLPRMGVKVRDDSGNIQTLTPANFAFSRSKWTFEARKAT